MSINRTDFPAELASMIDAEAAATGIGFAAAVRVLCRRACYQNGSVLLAERAQNAPSIDHPPKAQNGSETVAECAQNGSEVRLPPRARVEESLLLSSQRSIDSEEKTTKTTKPAPAAGFPEFWEAYPRKDGKKAAERAWTASAKSRPPLTDLLASLTAQASARGWPSQYTPHAATWLNGERWNDPAAAPGGNGNGAAARRALGADDERMRQYANVGVEWTPEDL